MKSVEDFSGNYIWMELESFILIYFQEYFSLFNVLVCACVYVSL